MQASPHRARGWCAVQVERGTVMTALGFVLCNLRHNRARAVFTIGSVVVAFLLFGLLMPLERLLESRVELACR
jgi:hypothetical protein